MSTWDIYNPRNPNYYDFDEEHKKKLLPLFGQEYPAKAAPPIAAPWSIDQNMNPATMSQDYNNGAGRGTGVAGGIPDEEVSTGRKAAAGALQGLARSMADPQLAKMPIDPTLGQDGQIFRRQAPQLGGMQFGGMLGTGLDNLNKYRNTQFVVGEQGPELAEVDRKGKVKIKPLKPEDVASVGTGAPVDQPNTGVSDQISPRPIPAMGRGTGPEGQSGLPVPSTPIGAEDTNPPDVDPDWLQHGLEHKREALIKRGEQHVSKGASALSYLFQGMENVGRNLQGQQGLPMVPLGKQRFANEIGNIDQRLQPLYQQKAANMKIQQEQAGINNTNAQAKLRTIQGIMARNPDLVPSIMKGGVVTPELQQMIYDRTGQVIPLMDIREFDNKVENGHIWMRPRLGSEPWKDMGVMNAAEEQTPIKEQIPGTSVSVNTTGEKSLNRANTIQAANVAYQGKAADANRQIAYQNQKDQRDAQVQQEDVDTKSAGLATEGTSLYNQGKEKIRKAGELKDQATRMMDDPRNSPKDIADLTKRADDLEIEGRQDVENGNAKIAQGANSKKVPPPVIQNTVPTQKVPQNKVVNSNGQYRGIIFPLSAIPQIKKEHAEWKDLSDEKVRAIIEQNGGRFK